MADMDALRKEISKVITDNDYIVYGNLDELEIPYPPTQEVRRPQYKDLAFTPQQVPAHRLKPIRHGMPRVPVELDGKDIDPQELSHYDGKPLYSTVRSIGKNGESQLVSFTDSDRAAGYIRGLAKTREHDGEDPSGFFGSHIQPPEPAYFFEHVNCQGARLQLDYRHVFWDLTEIWLGGILWWWTSWNDQISSLTTSGKGVTLYEHVFLGTAGQGGSWIDFGPNSLVLNLGDYGWNDRTSSINTTP